MGEPATDKGSATVTLSGEDIIICQLEGQITGSVVKGSMRRTRELTEEIRANGQKPKLLIDISSITAQTSEARSEAKRLSTFGIEKIAVAGGSRAIIIIGKYIARAGGMNGYTKFFRTNRQAMAWLRTPAHQISRNEGQAAIPIMSTFIATICTGILLGWAFEPDFLTSWLRGAMAMSPTNAVIFIALAFAFLLWRKARMKGARATILLGAALVCLAWGGLSILQQAFGWDFQIDQRLFRAQLDSSGGVAPNTSLNFLLLGGMILTVLGGMKRMWQRYLFHMFSVTLFATTLAAIVGIVFGISFYSGNYASMTFSTAWVFLFFGYAMQMVNTPLPFFKRRMQEFNTYWQPAVLLTVLLLMVGLAWQQSRQEALRAHNASIQEEFVRLHDGIVDRFDTYVNVLRGYKGFFESSDLVGVDEYKSYFNNSQPMGGYPGFAAISFIRAVPRADEATFIAEMRAQSSVMPAFASYSITPKTSNAVRYPLAYVMPYSSTTNWGFDLGTSKARRQALEKARDTGEPVASGAIDLNASQPVPGTQKRTGFFMTIPVYKHPRGTGDPMAIDARRQQIYGFINTVFENDHIFSDIFHKVTHNRDIKVVVTDLSEGTILYTHSPGNRQFDSTPRKQDELIVGGQRWSVKLYAPSTFGVSGLARILPYLILFGGGALALLAFGFLISQMRQRDQALKLADSMTEDLRGERNQAIVAQQKDEAILASIGDAVFAVDSQRRIVLFNPAAEAISGYTREEAIGKQYASILKFILEKDRKTNVAFIEKALSGHTAAMKNHTKLIRKDGSEVYVADSAAPIHNTSGKVVGAIVVFRDVSKELQLEQAKSEFVSLASHQLRTPLSAINWYSEMLLGGDAGKLNKAQQEHLREIYEGNQRMIELVDALLNVSRLEVGKLKNERQHVSMLDLADSLEKELQTTITSKKLTLKRDLDKTISTVYADPKLLRMIVQNLLSNAVKYTPNEGTVTLTMRQATAKEITAAKQHPGQSYFFMSVADTGYGIPKQQQPKVFEKLFRADNVRKLDVEGTGLGLYIIKEVTEKLGGGIWFESTESIGTTFYVVIPFKTRAS